MTRLEHEKAEADRELAAAILARDRKATAELVRLYADAIYSFVWRRLAPRTDAVEDLVQEVFLAALSGMKGYAGPAPLKSWLLGIARHKVEDHYREVLRSPSVSETAEGMEDCAAAGPGLEAVLDEQRTSERATLVLEHMRYDYALLLRWRYWDERPAREIAIETGKTEKAVERMLARAREEFRRLWLSEEGGSGGETG